MSPLVFDTFLTATTNIVKAMLGMVSGVMVARMLGPHGRGQLAAIQTWPIFMALVSQLGVPEALVYYSAREPQIAGRYLGSAIMIALTSAAPFMLCGYLLMPFLLRAQTPAIVCAARWYLMIGVIFAVEGMMLQPLRGRGDFPTWNVMRLMPDVAWVGVIVLAWLYGRAAPTLLAAAILAAQALLSFPFGVLVRRRLPGSFLPDVRDVPRMLRYGLPCVATTLPQMLNLRLDQMLMVGLLQPREVGLYVVAVAWSGAVAPLLNALAAVITPAVAAAADEVQMTRRLAAGTRAASALALLACSTLILLTPMAVVVLFGEQFREAVPTALVLVPAAGVLGVNSVLEEGLRGMGRPSATLWAELAGSVITVAALAAMLRPMGILGAAMASLLGYSTVASVLLLSVWRYARTPPAALLLPRLTDLQLMLERFAQIARVRLGAFVR
jgi:O-antigen/teichoic acid export membrane protein